MFLEDAESELLEFRAFVLDNAPIPTDLVVGWTAFQAGQCGFTRGVPLTIHNLLPTVRQHALQRLKRHRLQNFRHRRDVDQHRIDHHQHTIKHIVTMPPYPKPLHRLKQRQKPLPLRRHGQGLPETRQRTIRTRGANSCLLGQNRTRVQSENVRNLSDVMLEQRSNGGVLGF